jgi:hypothetical protein
VACLKVDPATLGVPQGFRDRPPVDMAFEYSVSEVQEVKNEEDEPVVYISERAQLGYLPGSVAAEIGWSSR